MSYQKWLNELVASLAESAHHRYMLNVYDLLYIVGDKGAFDGIYRNLRIGNGETGALVINEHIPRHLALPALTQWVLEQLRREPIIAPELELTA